MHRNVKYVAISVSLLPFMLGLSHAAQNWNVDPAAAALGYSSEDSGTGAYLGVDVSDVTSDRVGALKLKEEKGVEVTMVDQDAPAGKAGLREHDVILTMNGTVLESGAQLRRMIHETPPGRIVTLGLSRDGQPLTVQVPLGDRRKEYSMSKSKDFKFEFKPMPSMPDIEIPEINVMVVRSSARSGLMVENLTPQLGEFFGVKNGNGVLVRSVEKGSRAEQAGLRAGDVIVKVNGEAVHDTGDFTRALRSKSGGSTTVSVVRDKKEQNLNLTLPEGKGSDDGSGELEESLKDQDNVTAEYDLRLSQVRDQIAKLQPQLEMAAQEAKRKAEDLARSKCQQEKALRDQIEKLQEIKPKLERELRRDQEKLKNEMERMRHEMQGDWLDI